MCDPDGIAPIPISLDKVVAWWAARVLGRNLKSSALRSVTSRLLTHVALLGSPVPAQVVASIWDTLPHVCASFPCEVSSAAPPLGDAGDGRLSTAIEFASARAEQSLLYRGLATLLLTAQALYCRPSAVLNGNLLRGQIASIPASAATGSLGGLVFRLVLPKPEKGHADMRTDSFPIPNGPATAAIPSWRSTIAHLHPRTSPGDPVFPDLDPVSDNIRGPAMSVKRATALSVVTSSSQPVLPEVTA